MENYIKDPNLPRGKVSLALVDGRIPCDIEKSLIEKEIKLIKTKKINELYDAISYHPDIMLCHVGEDEIVAAPNTHESVIYSLENEGFKIICGKKVLSKKYPLDIPYNVALIGKHAVCNVRHADEVLLDVLTGKGYEIINVNQGYAKCSISIINADAIVTSDSGIHNILSENNFKSLLITPGHIKLFEMNYGFIGGASGRISSSDIAFLGDVNLHPDAERMSNFLNRNDKRPISLGKNHMIDLGTLIPLKEYTSQLP
jgi:hypothetical protein